MAFPTVRSSIAASNDVDTNSHSITLPATIVAGDLILVVFATDGTPTITWDDVSFGAWTELTGGPTGTFRQTIRIKIADGTEDSGVLTVTLSGTAQQSAYVVYSVMDWFGDLAGVEGTRVSNNTGTSAAPDPGNLTVSWGNGDNLFFAFASNDGNANLSGHPLPDNQLTDNNGTSGVAIAGCSDEISIDTLDPTAFTMSEVDEWAAYTVGVRPVLGSSGVPSKMMFQRMLRNA